MDASQYKDYILVLFFIKCVSSKYAGQSYTSIRSRRGARFKDMVTLKGKSDIGDQINMKNIASLASTTTIYDPAWDSGSLLLKVVDETYAPMSCLLKFKKDEVDKWVKARGAAGHPRNQNGQ